ncbi:MAG: hypothetical protein AAF802_07575 [Planctomycetota bacterium]
MNLGVIYLKTFFCISGVAFLVAIVLAIGIRFWRRFHAGWIIPIAVFLGIALVFLGNSLFHRRLFVHWQQSQNTWVPKTGCLTYDPSFARLFATYSMSETEFRDWVADYPVPMLPHDNSLLMFDSERLGITEPELSFATESAPNGKQLRVYWADNVMYLSYNVM